MHYDCLPKEWEMFVTLSYIWMYIKWRAFRNYVSMVKWNTENISHGLSLVKECRFSAFRNRKILAFFFLFHTDTEYSFEFIEFGFNSRALAMYFIFSNTQFPYICNMDNNYLMGLFWDDQCTLPGTGPDK